jgi:poly(3-hydroxybutyrate) depolymerase
MKKWPIHLLLLVIGLITALILAVAAAFRLANYTNGRLVSSGKPRAYLLYVPKSYDPSIPTPLVISVHGFAQWPAHQMQLSQWNELADHYGFIVVYPSGTQLPLRWRTGEICNNYDAR